jgi:uncharacterized protein
MIKRLTLIFFTLILFGLSCLFAFDPGDPKTVKLIEAVKRSDAIEVQKLLNEGADPNCVDQEKIRAIQIAVNKQHIEIVRILLKAGAYAGLLNGQSPLLAASLKGNLDIVKLLLSTGINVNELPLVRYMVGYGGGPINIEVMRELIIHGADVNARFENESLSPILIAELHKDYDIVDLLRQAGADETELRQWHFIEAAANGDRATIDELMKKVDINEEVSGRTALQSAIANEHVQIVNLLLNAGADPNHRDKKDGSTLLMTAVSTNNEELIQIFLNIKIPLEETDNEGKTAFLRAASFGKMNSLEKLMNTGANIQAVDKNGHNAISNLLSINDGFKESYMPVLRWLVDKGVDVNAKDKYSQTPLDIAVNTGSMEAAIFLRDHGAVFSSIMDSQFSNAIQHKDANKVKLYLDLGADKLVRSDSKWFQQAIESSSPEVLKLFLDLNLDLGKTFQYGADALDFAVNRKDISIVRELLKAGAKPDASHLEQAAQSGDRELVELLKSHGAESPNLDRINTSAEIMKLLVTPEKALEIYRNSLDKFGPSESATILWNISEAFKGKNQNAEAERIYWELIEKFPEKPERISALDALGDVYMQRKDIENALKYYKQSANASYVILDEANYLDPGNGNSNAIEKLASYYESINDCENAIYWWQRYQSHAWCGNEAAAAENWQIHKIAVCKIKSGKVSEGITMLEDSVFNRTFELNIQSAVYLVDFYHQQGRLDELVKKFQERFGNDGYISETEKYIDLIQIADKKDAQGLWNILRDSSASGWLKEKAMDYFVSLGTPGSDLAMTKLTPENREFIPASIVLGKMKYKPAIKPIVSFLRFEKNRWAMEDLLYSLALMDDPEASKVVQKYVEEGSPSAIAAMKRLHDQ